MSRSDKNRISEDEEIPLAKRYSPVRSSKSSQGRRYLSLFSITIILFFFVFFFAQKRLSQAFLDQQINDQSTDNSLLGHLPYDEAAPEDLVTVLPGLDVHKDTYKALMKMSSAAERDGIQLILLSGYRSIELQREIFYGNKSRRNQIAIERAKVSAPPGYSEHSTGYAVDLGDGTMRNTDFEVEFEETPAYKWLTNNAARYHFILSFPKDNQQGVSFEPWHWRFEGTVEALKKFNKANKQLTQIKKTDIELPSK